MAKSDKAKAKAAAAKAAAEAKAEAEKAADGETSDGDVHADKRAMETTAPASSVDELRAQDLEVREAQRQASAAAFALKRKRERVAEARKEFEVQKMDSDRRKRREDMEKKTVRVIVQTRRERLVRVRGGFVPSRTPVLVTRRDLRLLEGMRKQGAIQLIVGELEKPASLLPARPRNVSKALATTIRKGV